MKVNNVYFTISCLETGTLGISFSLNDEEKTKIFLEDFEIISLLENAELSNFVFLSKDDYEKKLSDEYEMGQEDLEDEIRKNAEDAETLEYNNGLKDGKEEMEKKMRYILDTLEEEMRIRIEKLVKEKEDLEDDKKELERKIEDFQRQLNVLDNRFENYV